MKPEKNCQNNSPQVKEREGVFQYSCSYTTANFVFVLYWFTYFFYFGNMMQFAYVSPHSQYGSESATDATIRFTNITIAPKMTHFEDCNPMGGG